MTSDVVPASRRVAIIPARGGSKRLPRKNVLPLAGKPMLAHPVSIALESQLFSDVIVSTEDGEIAAVARDHGAIVHERDPSLAQDTSTVVQVCLDVLNHSDFGQGVSTFCCLYATAAFLQAEDLLAAYALFDSKQADAVMGVSEYPYHPVQALKEEGGYLASMWPEYQDVQSQHYPHLVVSNGTFYWAKKDVFNKERSFYSKRLVGYQVPADRAIDIDTPEDYLKAQKQMEQAFG